jgi:hypothetical protein
VSLKPGTLFRLGDLAGRDALLKQVEVRSGTLGALPLYAFREGWWRPSTFLDTADLKHLLRPPLQPVILGPFPAEEVQVRMTDAKGKVQSVRVRGAP